MMPRMGKGSGMSEEKGWKWCAGDTVWMLTSDTIAKVTVLGDNIVATYLDDEVQSVTVVHADRIEETYREAMAALLRSSHKKIESYADTGTTLMTGAASLTIALGKLMSLGKETPLDGESSDE